MEMGNSCSKPQIGDNDAYLNTETEGEMLENSDKDTGLYNLIAHRLGSSKGKFSKITEFTFGKQESQSINQDEEDLSEIRANYGCNQIVQNESASNSKGPSAVQSSMKYSSLRVTDSSKENTGSHNRNSPSGNYFDSKDPMRFESQKLCQKKNGQDAETMLKLNQVKKKLFIVKLDLQGNEANYCQSERVHVPPIEHVEGDSASSEKTVIIHTVQKDMEMDASHSLQTSVNSLQEEESENNKVHRQVSVLETEPESVEVALSHGRNREARQGNLTNRNSSIDKTKGNTHAYNVLKKMAQHGALKMETPKKADVSVNKERKQVRRKSRNYHKSKLAAPFERSSSFNQSPVKLNLHSHTNSISTQATESKISFANLSKRLTLKSRYNSVNSFRQLRTVSLERGLSQTAQAAINSDLHPILATMRDKNRVTLNVSQNIKTPKSTTKFLKQQTVNKKNKNKKQLSKQALHQAKVVQTPKIRQRKIIIDDVDEQTQREIILTNRVIKTTNKQNLRPVQKVKKSKKVSKAKQASHDRTKSLDTNNDLAKVYVQKNEGPCESDDQCMMQRQKELIRNEIQSRLNALRSSQISSLKTLGWSFA